MTGSAMGGERGQEVRARAAVGGAGVARAGCSGVALLVNAVVVRLVVEVAVWATEAGVVGVGLAKVAGVKAREGKATVVVAAVVVDPVD